MQYIRVGITAKDYEGHAIADGQTGAPAIIRDLLLQLLRRCPLQDPDASARIATKLLKDVQQSQGWWAVEDADMALIETAIRTNGPKFWPEAIAAVWQEFKGAVDSLPEVPVASTTVE